MKTECSKWYQHFVYVRIITFQSRKLLTDSSLTTDSSYVKRTFVLRIFQYQQNEILISIFKIYKIKKKKILNLNLLYNFIEVQSYFYHICGNNFTKNSNIFQNTIKAYMDCKKILQMVVCHEKERSLLMVI